MPGRSLTTVVAAALTVAGIAGCSSTHQGASHAPGTSAPASRSSIPAAAATARIDWPRLRNPIVASPDLSVKDPALVAVGSTWFLLFSVVNSAGTWRIGIEHSSDLRTWSPMTQLPHDPAVQGEASPDVERAPDGSYAVTYQSFPHDARGGMSKLYYRTTSDFVHFSAPRPLGLPLHDAPGDRMIDAALAWTPAGLLLGYKTGVVGSALAFEIARSTTGSIDGPWQLVGRPDIRVFGDTIENDQFIRVNGRWKLVGTSNQLDRPFLFDLTGNPAQRASWLRWSPGRQLSIPQEPWNPGTGITGATYEHANGAYLVDRKAIDGYYYLVYEDAPTMTGFFDQGHGVFAIARSTDLVHWTVPPR